ncbi:MAG: hypothetical protein CMK59_05020 [Proteobacteria bacterium]|nr:hypothetical protein [Pseudomonadota bacterium]
MRSVLLLSLLWGLAPCVPSLIHGEAIGMHHTDLFPALWSLWAWGMPDTSWTQTTLLGHPSGMGWFPPSVIRAFLAQMLIPFASLTSIFNFFVISSRLACILLSYWAARQWKWSQTGGFACAVLFGCSPMLHGFALEGIIEAMDAWTIPLWLGCVARGNRILTAFSFALLIISSWYTAACGMLILCMLLIFKREAAWSVLGILICGPIIYSFTQAWPVIQPFSSEISGQMSLHIQAPQPFWISNSTLGITGSCSLIASVFVLKVRSVKLLLLALPILLSFGFFHQLPIVNLMRFPYRWHLATLVIFCALLAPAVKDRAWLVWLIFAEQLLLSPIAPILPSSKVDIPDIYQLVDKPLLHIPGPYAQPAGVSNPSRMRASEFLLAQTMHQQPLINRGDFNGLESKSNDWWLSWDPLSKQPPIIPAQTDLRENTLILIQQGWLGKRSERLEQHLTELGSVLIERDRMRSLWLVPSKSKN